MTITPEMLALAERVLSSVTLARCAWDYDSETGEYGPGGCEAGAVARVEGPHGESCGEYCAEHARRCVAERCTPPHRFHVVNIPSAAGADDARALALLVRRAAGPPKNFDLHAVKRGEVVDRESYTGTEAGAVARAAVILSEWKQAAADCQLDAPEVSRVEVFRVTSESAGAAWTRVATVRRRGPVEWAEPPGKKQTEGG